MSVAEVDDFVTRPAMSIETATLRLMPRWMSTRKLCKYRDGRTRSYSTRILVFISASIVDGRPCNVGSVCGRVVERDGNEHPRKGLCGEHIAIKVTLANLLEGVEGRYFSMHMVELERQKVASGIEMDVQRGVERKRGRESSKLWLVVFIGRGSEWGTSVPCK